MPHIKANGLNIFYREVGKGDPCLLLQGFEMDHRGWALQIPALREHWRCISIDNRDVGQSDSAPAPYGVADMAADALGVLDALGIQRAHLVGHSLGGAIAQEIAIAHPQRVHRIVLISTYIAMGPRDRAIAEARKLFRARLSLAEYYSATFPWVYSDADYAVPGQVEAIRQQAAANPNPQPYDAFCRQCDAVLSHNSSDRIGRITAPTLVLTGDADLLTTLEQSERLRDAIPNARLQVIPGGGHGILWTQHAAQVNEALVAFLKG